MQLYVHFDIDAFFASVETALRPGLGETAVVVGGRGRRGVVSCANYPARALGIHAAMPMYQARRPGVTIFGVRHHAYRAVSGEIEALFSTMGTVEMRSIDEGYVRVDVPETALDELLRDIEQLRGAASERYGLGVSVGVAGSATVAKIAGGRAKPGGVRFVEPDSGRAFVLSGRLDEIPGLGSRGREQLAEAGIDSVPDLDRADERTLRRTIGAARADAVRRVLRGEDPVETGHARPQVSSSITFDQDLGTPQEVEDAVLRVLADAWRRVNGRSVRAVSLRITTAGQTTSRSRRLPVPTEEPRNLTSITIALLADLGRDNAIGPVRLLSVSLETTDGGGQDELFAVEGPDMPRLDHRDMTLGDVVFRGMRITHPVFGPGLVTGAGREGLLVRFADGERLLDPGSLGRDSWSAHPARRGEAQSSVAAVSASANEPNPPPSSP